MTKRHTILHKKLQELETDLNQVSSLPPESTTPCHHLLSESIEKRFLFLNNLLSAEITSRNPQQHHLEHISRSLSQLESKFHQWDNYKPTTITIPPPVDDVDDDTDATVFYDQLNDEILDDDFDQLSKCSCTESCLNDFDEEDTEFGDGYDFDGNVEFEDRVAVAEMRRAKDDEMSERRCGFMGNAVTVIVGLMGFVMGSLYGCADFEGNDFTHLTPT